MLIDSQQVKKTVPENAPDAISESLKNKFPGAGHAPRPPYSQWAYAHRYMASPPSFFSQTLISPTLGTISK